MRLIMLIGVFCIFSLEANCRTEYQISKDLTEKCKKGYKDFLSKNGEKVIKKITTDSIKLGVAPTKAFNDAKKAEQKRWINILGVAIGKIDSFCKGTRWYENCVVKMVESPSTGVLCSLWRVNPKTREYSSMSSPDRKFPDHPR